MYTLTCQCMNEYFMKSCVRKKDLIGASVSESHLGSSTRPLSVCLSVYIYISYVRHFWSRGPRATRKRKPAHLKFKGHMLACCIILGKCYALWGERERRAVVSVSNLRCWLSESCCRRSSLSCVVSASNLRLWLML